LKAESKEDYNIYRLHFSKQIIFWREGNVKNWDLILFKNRQKKSICLLYTVRIGLGSDLLSRNLSGPRNENSNVKLPVINGSRLTWKGITKA
jgi:hypothetical protein